MKLNDSTKNKHFFDFLNHNFKYLNKVHSSSEMFPSIAFAEVDYRYKASRQQKFTMSPVNGTSRRVTTTTTYL